MNRDDVIRMAREAGMEDIHLDGGLFYASPDDLIKFAYHVAEECAKACDEKHHSWRWDDEPDSNSGPRECSSAIRSLYKPTVW